MLSLSFSARANQTKTESYNELNSKKIQIKRLQKQSKSKLKLKYKRSSRHLEEIQKKEQNNFLICSSKIHFSYLEILSDRTALLKCLPEGWKNDDIIVIRPETTEVGGILQVTKVEPQQVGLKLLSIQQDRFPMPQDYLEKIDLSQEVENLNGTSYFWRTKVLPSNTSYQYRPLITQGATIGETAQTLWKHEVFFDAFGTLGYGITNGLSFSTNLAALALGSPNGVLKGRVYQNDTQTWSLSLSSAQERSSSEKLFNVDLMWDSILNKKMIAHSLVSAAVISFDSAKDAAVLKSYGNSSIQTGYEYIFDDWSRFLIGPSYNIDQKAIGGYIGYVKIINNLHLQASLTTSNIRELKMSAKEGYFFILDAYWRW